MTFGDRWEETRYFEMYSHKHDLRLSITVEHEAFHGGLVALEEYFVSCLPPGTAYGFGDKVAPPHEQAVYEGGKIQTIIDTFAEPMALHVSMTISSLSIE